MHQDEINRDISGIQPDENTSTKTKVGKNYLLGIGIDRYQDFIPLKNAVKDVQDISNILISKYEFEQSNVKLLLNEAATRENIIEELDQLSLKVEENDKILIYYSGHGFLNEENNRGYWIPIEAKNEKPSTYVANANLRDYIKSIKSRHTLLISDSCFSGSLMARDATRQISGAYDTWEAKKSRYVFASGKGIVSDGIENENSPFAKAIIDQLSNPAEPKLNIVRLADEVTRTVRFNHEQQPEIHPFFDTGHDGGQFVFNLKNNIASNVATKLISQAKNIATETIPRRTPLTSAIIKLLPFLMMIPIGIWYFGSSPSDTIAVDKTSDNVAMAPTVKKSVPPPISPVVTMTNSTLSLNTKWSDDNIIITIDGGQPPYELIVMKGGKEKASKDFNKPGVYTYPIGAFRSNPGRYTFKIFDDNNRTVEKQETIDRKKPGSTEPEVVTNPTTSNGGAGVTIPKPGLPAPGNATSGFVAIGSQKYKWRRLKDGKKWMTENLNYKTPNSWCLGNDKSNCKKFGRLYLWKDAKIVCPDGWRLPTDADWKNLAKKYGGYDDLEITKNIGNIYKPYSALQSKNGFAAKLGGTRKDGGNYGRPITGFYWTSTEMNNQFAYSYFLYSPNKTLRRKQFEKTWGFSCRCVAD